MVDQVAQVFKFNEMMVLGENLKFFYIDEDGDTISVTNQSDLEAALKVMPDGKMRLVVAKSFEDAR